MTQPVYKDGSEALEPPALALSLLVLRVGVTIVMVFWTVDKLLNPDHAGKVFKGFCGMEAVGANAFALIAVGQGLVVVAFAAGAFRTISYGAVRLMHSISTLVSWKQYLDPFENLLFLAAWPMRAACVASFLTRDQDCLLTVSGEANTRIAGDGLRRQGWINAACACIRSGQAALSMREPHPAD